MSTPYPGFDPRYKVVKRTAGYERDCMVLDILSLDTLNNAERSVIQEQLSGFVLSLIKKMPNLHRCELVTSDRFDKMLAQGLRLAD